MRPYRIPPGRPTRALALCAAALVLVAGCASEPSRDPGSGDGGTRQPVAPPPVGAPFDYQLGGAYPPPKGVRVVVRDHTASPARGLYNVCYVNAFQAQPHAERDWDADLLLRDGKGRRVYDTDWDEALLDLRTADRRDRAARKVNAWIDRCADKGFDAVEPDNYDSYTRAPKGTLTARHARSFLTLLARHAHRRGLAVAQKNTAELAPDRERVGLDFAVVEECGRHHECGAFTRWFGRRLLVVEYDRRGLRVACRDWGDRVSVVRRDLDVAPAGESGHLRQTCRDR